LWGGPEKRRWGQNGVEYKNEKPKRAPMNKQKVREKNRTGRVGPQEGDGGSEVGKILCGVQAPEQLLDAQKRTPGAISVIGIQKKRKSVTIKTMKDGLTEK